MLTIAPPSPEAVTKIIDSAWEDASGSDPSMRKFDDLPQSRKEFVYSVTNFLAFHILEELSSRAQPEVDSLIQSLNEALQLPDLNEIDIQSISSGILNLRQLKGGGMVPGERIHTSLLPRLIKVGAPVLVRHASIKAKFTVAAWSEDYSEVQCVTEEGPSSIPSQSIACPLSSLIFLENP
jgi:hypothetical protein|tara:strand:- start:5196 stop:5735 length:540 start_codon:yes stop_codon:yes gene_type:complete